MIHVVPPNMLHIFIVMPMRVIIAQLPSLKGTEKSKLSSVSLGFPLLPIIWPELSDHPNLWWEFESTPFFVPYVSRSCTVILMRWLVDMKGACDILLVALESLASCLLSCAPCVISISIARITAFQYRSNSLVSLLPWILNCRISDMRINLSSSLKVFP